ncbi:MAG: L,D-transpeptidase [Candidatus Levybacteria bacterium]|nr:L,D-transpeptidase [Candidatus Levybacteria bacterium]
MKYLLFALGGLLIVVSLMFWVKYREDNVLTAEKRASALYWMLLERKSNREFLYHGIPGDVTKSKRVRIFRVKTGVPGERPTPLPQLLGREYWFITKKYESSENPETAPYFLELDIPVLDEKPFGPMPYLECQGSTLSGSDGQCNWILPGAFGLHGINGDPTRLGDDNPGSSGCIRHKDEDITYLYNVLEPEKHPVKYYIEDE